MRHSSLRLACRFAPGPCWVWLTSVSVGLRTPHNHTSWPRLTTCPDSIVYSSFHLDVPEDGRGTSHSHCSCCQEGRPSALMCLTVSLCFLFYPACALLFVCGVLMRIFSLHRSHSFHNSGSADSFRCKTAHWSTILLPIHWLVTICSPEVWSCHRLSSLRYSAIYHISVHTISYSLFSTTQPPFLLVCAYYRCLSRWQEVPVWSLCVFRHDRTRLYVKRYAENASLLNSDVCRKLLYSVFNVRVRWQP